MAKKQSKAKAKVLGLYWVATPDHDEDWFILAYSAAQALRIHEDEEGYDHGYAHSELVLTLPADKQNEEVGWPSMELLEELGGKILPIAGSGVRVVRFGDRTYSEGDIVSNVAHNLGLVDKN